MLLGSRRTTAHTATMLLATSLLAALAQPVAATAPPEVPTAVEVVDPAGWRATFPAQPTRSDGSSNGSVIQRAEADNDIVTVASYPETTFALAETPPAQQAEIYAQNFGGGRVNLVNTPTTLATSPAAVFIFDLNAESGPARMFGVAVRRAGRITFATYFDRGRDSADAGRAFVESYAIAVSGAAPADQAVVGSTPATPAAVAVSGQNWQLSFPAGTSPTSEAGIRHGLGAQWWTAAVAGDTLRVDAGELPGGYEFSVATTAELGAQIASPGATLTASAGTSVGNHQAASFTATSAAGATVSGVVVQLPTQLVTVSYTDVGGDNPAESSAWLAALATT